MQQNSGDWFCQNLFVHGKFAIFGHPIKHNKHPLNYSPVSRRPPYFSLVPTYGNNSRKWAALVMDTFFQFPRVSTYETVDCTHSRVQYSANSLRATERRAEACFVSATKQTVIRRCIIIQAPVVQNPDKSLFSAASVFCLILLARVLHRAVILILLSSFCIRFIWLYRVFPTYLIYWI